MARALKNSETDPTYLDFFGMTRPPFSQLPVASQIFHSEQYSLLMAHLASATKQADCLMVICGADGSGKTTLLNRYITSINDDTTFATFDETCPNGIEFYCAFLRQLGFHDISGKLQELRRITREFLIHRGKAQDPVLLIMDNAHLVSPTVLEQLRWIAETKVDERRVLSVVLAGNQDLPRIMESPAMKSVRFRTHVDFNIRVYSEEETEDYVRHRLRLAGGVDAAKFSREAHPLIYRFSGGIPSVINMLCNEVLGEACAQETRVITEELIRTIADRNRLEPNVFKFTGRGRRKTDPDYALEVPDPKGEERITARAAPVNAALADAMSRSGFSEAEVVNLQMQVAELSSKLTALEADNELTQRELGNRDQDVNELRTQLTAKMRENEALAATAIQIDDLQQQLTAKTHENELLPGAIKEIEDLRTQLAETTRESEKLSSKVAEIDGLREQLAAKIKEVNELTSTAEEAGVLRERLAEETREVEKLAEVASTVNDVQAQLAEKDDEITRLAATAGEAETLRERLAGKTREVKELEAASAEIDDLRQQLASKTREVSELEAVTAEIDNLRQQLASKTREVSELEAVTAEIGDLRQQLVAKSRDSEQLSSTTAEIDVLQRQLATKTREVSELEAVTAEIDDLREQLVAKSRDSEQLSSTTAEIDVLQRQLATKTREVSELEAVTAEIDDLREQLVAKSRDSEQLSSTTAEIDVLQRQLATKTREVDELEAVTAEIDNLREQLVAKSRDSEQLSSATAEIDVLQRQLATKTREVDELEAVTAEIDNLREQLVAKSRDSEQLSSATAEIDVLQRQLATKTREIEKLNSTTLDNAAEIERLNRRLSERTDALADSEKLVKSLSVDLKEEQQVSKTALQNISKAEKQIEKLDKTEAELRQTVSALSAEMELAQRDAKKLPPLENEIALLHDQIETQAEELKAREERVTELETLLKVALHECEKLRDSSTVAHDYGALLSDKDTRIEILEAELATYSHLNTTTQPSLDDEQADVAADTPDQCNPVAQPDLRFSAIDVIRGGQVEQVVTIADMPPRIMIGRGDDSDLHLDSKFVSRHHALLFLSNDGLYIEDLNSFNGTIVNSRKVVRCKLQPDDKIVIGDYQLRAR